MPVRERMITEIQTYVNAREVIYGITPTTWTSFDGGVRINHVNEIREAIENMLSVMGVSLSDYLTMDGDGNVNPPYVTDWLDGNRLAKSTPVRGMYIEQIRKSLNIVDEVLMEQWSITPSETILISNYPGISNIPIDGDIARWTHTPLYKGGVVLSTMREARPWYLQSYRLSEIAIDADEMVDSYEYTGLVLATTCPANPPGLQQGYVVTYQTLSVPKSGDIVTMNGALNITQRYRTKGTFANQTKPGTHWVGSDCSVYGDEWDSAILGVADVDTEETTTYMIDGVWRYPPRCSSGRRFVASLGMDYQPSILDYTFAGTNYHYEEHGGAAMKITLSEKQGYIKYTGTGSGSGSSITFAMPAGGDIIGVYDNSNFTGTNYFVSGSERGYWKAAIVYLKQDFPAGSTPYIRYIDYWTNGNTMSYEIHWYGDISEVPAPGLGVSWAAGVATMYDYRLFSDFPDVDIDIYTLLVQGILTHLPGNTRYAIHNPDDSWSPKTWYLASTRIYGGGIDALGISWSGLRFSTPTVNTLQQGYIDMSIDNVGLTSA